MSKAGTSYTYGSSKPHAVTQAGTNSYAYDNNGNMTSGAGRTYTWNGEDQPVQIARMDTPTETYVYDGDNVRIKRAVWGKSLEVSVYVGKVEYRGSQVISTYGGAASRTTTGNPTSTNKGTLVYMHSDHLGSVSMTTSATGTIAQTQEFDPWGAVKSGGITSVSYNYTGQRLDGTGLLFYNARYYDPQLARFTSADSIVPTTSHRSLTVDYHENKFNGSLQEEYDKKFWFLLDEQERKQADLPWGPNNTQELNRFSYVNNNPLRYNDPSGHCGKSFMDTFRQLITLQCTRKGWTLLTKGRWKDKPLGALVTVLSVVGYSAVVVSGSILIYAGGSVIGKAFISGGAATVSSVPLERYGLDRAAMAGVRKSNIDLVNGLTTNQQARSLLEIHLNRQSILIDQIKAFGGFMNAPSYKIYELMEANQHINLYKNYLGYK